MRFDLHDTGQCRLKSMTRYEISGETPISVVRKRNSPIGRSEYPDWEWDRGRGCEIPWFSSSTMSEQKTIHGLVTVHFEPGPEILEDDLNDRYGSDRLIVPGFGITTAVQYKATGSQAPTWLTLYDVAIPIPSESKECYMVSTLDRALEETLKSKTAGSVSRRSYTFLGAALDPDMTVEDLPGRYLLAVSFEILPENEDDFNRCVHADHAFRKEHMALVARIPGWKRGRRYKLVEYERITGSINQRITVPTEYLALHELDNGDFEQSAEIKHARGTQWAQRVIRDAVRREVMTFELHKVLTRAKEER
ncbi:putative alpha/beta hydrolase [Mycena venus]|uniref:Putative alpha/beta hydrolase n=1 Tax=Mycena venus TaxID=2733690 RepID=A0A8H6YWL3_9AGAR|nr:putative alpha/beta hydrolase [Mycena venus]